MLKFRYVKVVSLVFGCVLAAACSTPSGSLAGKGAAGNGGYGDSNGAYANGAGGRGGFNDVSSYANRDDLRQYHTIYFDYDSNNIHPWGLAPINAQAQHDSNPNPQAMQVIHAYAAYLLNHSSARLFVDGNTDARGSREYNVALGERRANAIADVLRMDGVSASQITVVSYGKEKPVALGANENAYSQNRRVDMKFNQG